MSHKPNIEKEFAVASQQLRESLLAGTKDVCAAKRKLKIALHALDEDGDGSVTTEELRDYILSHGVCKNKIVDFK